MHRLGVVSYLNARPLIEGLAERARVELCFDVPARLGELLGAGRVDAALIPIIDVLRSAGRYEAISDAGIASDGETMTVRVFSQAPPHRIETLWVDPDSHTSVALADVLWREQFDRCLELRPLREAGRPLHELEAVLLIGDKVVDPARGSFAFEVDLGGAWRQHTGLPFVFAMWATRAAGQRSERDVGHAEASLRPLGRRERAELDAALRAARELGVARAELIARTQGPALGWPLPLARRYLTQCLKFTLDARFVEGANLFGRLCAKHGLAPSDAEIRWPAPAALAQA